MAGIYQHFSDSELVAKLRVGDEMALGEIFDRYWQPLFVASMNRLGDQQDAEECVQDILLKMWSLRETLYIENDNLYGYLSVAVKNQVFNRRLKKHREKLRAKNYKMLDTESNTPEQTYMARELEARLDGAIQNLPTQCRIVFTMNKKDGKTVKQIADDLAISENTVKYHLKKANRDIRDSLKMIIWLSVVFF